MKRIALLAVLAVVVAACAPVEGTNSPENMAPLLIGALFAI